MYYFKYAKIINKIIYLNNKLKANYNIKDQITKS